MESKIGYLTLIQGVINRMGQNSFLLKGWSVTLIAALFVLSSKDSNNVFLLVTYFPALMFWFLDAFFLTQEKLYRKLYKKIANNNNVDIDFSLDTENLNTDNYLYIKTLFSKTIILFHGLIIGILFLVAFIVLNK